MTSEHNHPDDSNHKKLGRIFIERGLLTEISADRMASRARGKKILFGTYLEQMGLVTPDELAEALAVQFKCKKIGNFARHTFPPQLLRSFPIELVVEHTIFPLKMEQGKLGLAVVDPTNTKLFDQISAQHSVEVILFVSTRIDINRAIARHYMGRDVVGSQEKTVLLVEDDDLVRKSVSELLRKNGYSVETATDPMAAFKIIFTQNPMMIITDKVMPKLGGYEFLDAVRKIPEFRFTPVILMTANADPEEEQLAFQKGFFDIILKPVKEVSMLKRVKRALQSVERHYK